ncbi:hypothetical protein G9A89_000827 [Geosiphon pyriformis]|nr:hypothetical protein G9A89_000827 [Geosiphon pyriformis]
MTMNTNSKSLVAISKALLQHGSHKKLMLVLTKESLDGHQQMLEKRTPLSPPERRTQGPSEVVIKYIKAIRKLIKETDIRKQYWYTLMKDIVPEESLTIKLSKQSTKLWFQETTDKLLPLNLLAESEIIGANHLGFAKSLFQKYSQQLGLNNNHYPAELAFNYYVNDKITDCLGGTVNIKSVRENFYTELFQHTSLPRNHSFTPIIREINQTIKRYMQQQFLITYADKGKRRLKIQPPTWKKTKVESPAQPLYHYTPKSAINFLSIDAVNKVKQNYWELLPDFRTASPWEVTESEEKQKGQEKKESEDQKFTYQNLILENPEQSPQQLNPQIQQLQGPPQQPPLQQQPLQQPQQQPNINQVAYAPITKLDNFTGKEDDAQAWINDVSKAIIANN